MAFWERKLKKKKLNCSMDATEIIMQLKYEI